MPGDEHHTSVCGLDRLDRKGAAQGCQELFGVAHLEAAAHTQVGQMRVADDDGLFTIAVKLSHRLGQGVAVEFDNAFLPRGSLPKVLTVQDGRRHRPGSDDRSYASGYVRKGGVVKDSTLFEHGDGPLGDRKFDKVFTDADIEGGADGYHSRRPGIHQERPVTVVRHLE